MGVVGALEPQPGAGQPDRRPCCSGSRSPRALLRDRRARDLPRARRARRTAACRRRWPGRTSLWARRHLPVLILLPLLFPDGHLLSPRWRPSRWLCVGCLAFLAIGVALRRRRLDVATRRRTPPREPSLRSGARRARDLRRGHRRLLLGAARGRVASMVLRFRGRAASNVSRSSGSRSRSFLLVVSFLLSTVAGRSGSEDDLSTRS